MLLRAIALCLALFLVVPLRADTQACTTGGRGGDDACPGGPAGLPNTPVPHAPTAAGCATTINPQSRLACWDHLYRAPGTRPKLTEDPGAETGLRWAVARDPTDGDRPALLHPPAASVSRPLDLDNPGSQPEQTDRTGWTLIEDTTPFSPHRDVYLSVPSEGITRCGKQTRATLYLRCLNDRTSVHITHDCVTPRQTGANWTVDLSLDNGPVTSDQMLTTDDSGGFGHFSYREARTLIERLAEASSLHVQFDDLNGVRSRLRFPLIGIAEHLPRLTEACHWSQTPPWVEAENEASNPLGAGP